MVADPSELEQQRVLPAGFAVSAGWDRDEAYRFVEELFARHQNEIYAYLVRMLRDPELAADLTQDAFVKAYKAYDSLEKPENARAWLYQIAHRVALDDFRRKRIVRFVPLVGETRNTAPSAEHLVMDAHLSGELQRALERIPERQRSALLLAELHDLTGVELAATLGVSHVAARALLTRARESLRQALSVERQALAEAEAAGRRPPGGQVVSPRFGRNAGAGDHERARDLASLRMDEPLADGDARWLDAHLGSCPACAAMAASFDDDRLLLRSLRTAEPQAPRDLWARTAAALEAEADRHPGRSAPVRGSFGLFAADGRPGRSLLDGSCPSRRWRSRPSPSALCSCPARCSPRGWRRHRGRHADHPDRWQRAGAPPWREWFARDPDEQRATRSAPSPPTPALRNRTSRPHR